MFCIIHYRNGETITCNYEITSCNYEISSCNYEITSCDYEITSCNYEISSCNYEITSCNYEITSCDYEISSCNYEITSCDYEITSCNYEITSCDLEVSSCNVQETFCLLSSTKVISLYLCYKTGEAMPKKKAASVKPKRSAHARSRNKRGTKKGSRWALLAVVCLALVGVVYAVMQWDAESNEYEAIEEDVATVCVRVEQNYGRTIDSCAKVLNLPAAYFKALACLECSGWLDMP